MIMILLKAEKKQEKEMKTMNKYIYCLNNEDAKYLCDYFKLIFENNGTHIFENILLDKNNVPILENMDIVFMDKLIISF